jgi:hypothetical protein
MADVTKVPGSGSNIPGPEPAKVDAKRFEEAKKRVGDSEEKQKKGNKKQTESEEELKADIRTGALEPDKAAEGAKKGQKVPQIQAVGESEKRQPQSQKRREEIVPEAAVEAPTAAAPMQRITPVKIEAELTKLETKLETIAQPPAPPLEPAAQMPIPAEKKVEEEIKTKEKEEVAKKVTVKKKVEKAEAHAEAAPVVPPAASTLGPLFIGPASAAAPSYMTLKPEILALFEKMVGVISVMKDMNDTETTIHLNTPEFANSKFFGAQIVIKEYSTAPLAYNIEFQGTAQNAADIEKEVGAFMNAFQTGNHNFSIHRFESRLLQQQPEKPLFHRKEPPPEKEKE